MDYSTFPKDLIYIIVSYLDKYDINKFIMSSESLMTVFNKEENWKEMLYINIDDPVIDLSITWRDNYINNLNIESKLNIKIIDRTINYDDYIIFFRDILTEKDELPDNTHDLHSAFDPRITNVAFIKNIHGDVAFFGMDKKISTNILDYIGNKLKIKNSCIGFRTHTDDISIADIENVIEAVTDYNHNQYHNIISCYVGDFKVLLMYAPDIS